MDFFLKNKIYLITYHCERITIEVSNAQRYILT